MIGTVYRSKKSNTYGCLIYIKKNDALMLDLQDKDKVEIAVFGVIRKEV